MSYLSAIMRSKNWRVVPKEGEDPQAVKIQPDEPGTTGWHIHPALVPSESDVVIQKWTPDAFYRTPLQEELARGGIKQVILMGMQTECCIDKLAVTPLP